MMKITVLVGLVALSAGQDLTRFYEGWNHAVGLKSSFTDRLTAVFEKAKEDMHFMDLHKPMVSLLETGSQASQGVESMSEGTAMKLINFLKPIQEAVEALEFQAAAARGEYGFSMGGHGMPRSDSPQGKAIWEAMVKSMMPEEDKKAGSFLETSSATEAQAVSTSVMNQRNAAGAKSMRSSQGKALLQFAEQYAASIEKDAVEAEEKQHAMMDKLMTMTLSQRKPLMKEYEQLKRNAAIAKQAHESFDMDTDNIYKLMSQFPDEQMMDPAEVAFDSKVDKEFEELLHDPKMAAMMQMGAEVTQSSLMQTSAEATQMASMEVTAQGRVSMMGVDEEGTEEQGATQAAELLKMFDVHVGHYGSAPSTLASFLQTHDQLSEQQQEAAQTKALLERRVSKAMSRSASIDKLLDDAIMDYLSDPKTVEEKPSVLEEIAGAFRSNSDPLFSFTEHPFIARYRSEQKQMGVLPPRPVQRQLIDSLLKDAPANMKMAVIHANLDAPGTRELKIQQDLICMKKTLMKMKKSDLDAHGKDGELRIFVDVQGGLHSKTNERVVKEIQRALEDVEKVYALNKLGDQAAQDYAVGLSDFVYRIGEGQLADSHNLDMAAFKTEALKRGGIIRADVTKAPAEMCTLDNQNLEVATTHAFEKFARINKIVQKVEQEKKEKKMLSETEQWAEQQRRVEHNHKSHQKAQVDVDFKPVEFVRGFANFLKKGATRSQTQAARAASYAQTSDKTSSKRHGPNYGLYMPRSRTM